MAQVSMNIHCTDVTARASSHNGTEWVTLIFVRGDEQAEITVFFARNGAAELFAAHVGAFNEQTTSKAAAPEAEGVL